MITASQMIGFVKAEPFCPFRIHMASGRTFEVRHPEMIKVLKSYVLVFRSGVDDLFPEEFETLSLMLTVSVSYLEPASTPS